MISLWQDILFHVWLLMKKISSDNISDAIVLTRARHTLEKTPKNKRIRPTFESNPYRKTVRWSIPFAINACERVVFCCPTRLHILYHPVTVCWKIVRQDDWMFFTKYTRFKVLEQSGSRETRPYNPTPQDNANLAQQLTTRCKAVKETSQELQHRTHKNLHF